MKATKCRPFVDKIKGHREPIVAMLSPNGDNGQRLYSASTDGWLYVWDIPNKEITHKIQLSIPPTTTQLSFTCIELNQNVVYGGLISGEIYSWNIKSGEIIGCYHHHSNKIISLQKISSRVLTSIELAGKEVVLWDTLSARLEDRVKLAHQITAFTATEERLFIIAERHHLYVFDTEKRTMQYTEKLNSAKYYVNVMATQHYLFLATDRCELEVTDLPYRPNNPTKTIPTGDAWVYSIIQHSFGNNGRQLLLGCSDGSIRYLQMKSETTKEGYFQIDRVDAHDASVNCVVLCSGLLFTGSSDCNIKSWNLLELRRQHQERQLMYKEELESRRYEVYLKCKKKKKSKKGKRKPNSN